MAAVTDDTQTETAVPLFTVYIITYFWPVPTIGPGVGYTDSREIYRTARKILKYVGPKPIEKTVNAQELKDMKELDGGSKLLRYCDPKLILGPDDWRLNAPDLLGEESDEDEDNNDEDEENLHSDGGLEDMFATNGLLHFLETVVPEVSKEWPKFKLDPKRGANLMPDLGDD